MTLAVEAQPLIVKPTYDWRYAACALYSAIKRGERECLAVGPRGSGKTLLIGDMCLRFALQYPGMTIRWGRLDRTRMDETVLKTFEEEVLPAYPQIKFPSVKRSQREGYEFPNGSRITIHGLRDIETMKSMAADLWWVNEPSELPEGHWEDIGATGRKQRFGVTPFRVKIGDVNPMPPAHWTNTRCPHVPESLYPKVLDDGTRMREWFPPEKWAAVTRYNLAPIGDARCRKVLFFHVENPGYWNFDAYDWEPPGLEYVQKELGRYTGSRRARWLEGRPSAEEGVVFDDFNREKHLIEPFANGWPADWPVWMAYDPGYRHPCAVLFVGIAPNGQPFIIDEIWGPRINIKDLGPMILAKQAKYRIIRRLADPKGADQATQLSNGKTAMSYMREEFGLYFEPWKAKSGRVVQDQVEAARVWLVQDEPLQVFDTCVGFISNIESWQNKVNKDGTEPEGDESYEDRNNDCIDPWLGIVADGPKFDHPKAMLA